MRHLTTLSLAGLALLPFVCAPNRSSADEGRVDLQALIDQAVKTGGGTVTVPRNAYRLASKLCIRNANGLVLDAQGSTLVFTDDRDGGIVAEDSKAVTLKNLTIDFDPLPYTQGVISQADAKGKHYDITVDAGYPDGP